jgi:hypothetical protein
VRVDASLDAPLSRWLWLAKWVLVIPHLIVLAILWIGFVILSAVAWVAILAMGRYPRGTCRVTCRCRARRGLAWSKASQVASWFISTVWPRKPM